VESLVIVVIVITIFESGWRVGCRWKGIIIIFVIIRRGDNVKTLHQSQNSVPFALKNATGSSNKILVEIENPFEAEDENLFLTVQTSFSPSTGSVASTVMGFFTGVAIRGVERTEEVLPVDRGG
jgi:hypothetical protein